MGGAMAREAIREYRAWKARRTEVKMVLNRKGQYEDSLIRKERWVFWSYVILSVAGLVGGMWAVYNY